MKLVAILITVLMSLQAFAAEAATKIDAPKPGYGIVVIELINPETVGYDSVSNALLNGDRGETYRKNAKKLSSEAWKVWKAANGLDYGLLIGARVPETEVYDVVEGVWDYEYGMGANLASSLDLYRDEATGRLWYIGQVPAGDAVIFGFNVQTYWQIRFDAGAPHFVVPDGGFVFIGAVDGALNRQRVADAVAAKVLPNSIKSISFPAATCENVIEGFSPAEKTDNSQGLAAKFLAQQLGRQVELAPLATDMRRFSAKQNDGWVKKASHRCVKANP